MVIVALVVLGSIVSDLVVSIKREIDQRIGFGGQ